MTGNWFNRVSKAIAGGRLGSDRASHLKSLKRRTLRLEFLEARSLLSLSIPGFAVPQYVALAAEGGVVPLSSSGPTGYSPAQIRHAYGFDQISFGGVAGDGAGTTIAIVDAYDDPNIANDLKQFDKQFGLPDPVFTKVNQTGGSSMPTADSGWATEIALDVEWAHAIAPKANILLVEANSAYFSDLLAAVDYARRYTGVVAVSMSWGGGDFQGETDYDGYFTTTSGHAGVTFLASSGDNGAPALYPCVSPNVVAVGGTTLSLNGQNWYGESGWSGSGGGISNGESQPSYQKGVVTQSTTRRCTPDVSYDSNPATGVPIYDTFGTMNPWIQIGGTSAAAPQWAALIAIADQGRALAGKASLDGATQTLPMLYGLSSADFHDITTGGSTGSPNYSAGPGYDLVTGRGSPIANLVVRDLVGTSNPTGPAPTLSSIVVAESTPQNGVLNSNEQGVISWAVTRSNPLTSTVLTIDGSSISAMYGPYGPYSGSYYYYSGTFNPLAVGNHSYTIRVTDSAARTTTATGSFVVASAGPAPTISQIVVAEATPQNGVLSSNEQGVISWAVTRSNPLTSTVLTVDGSPISAMYGPYGPYSGSYYYSGTFSPLAAGSHTYTIRVTDSAAQTTTATGSFVVASAGPVISQIVVTEAIPRNGALNSGEQGVISWAVTDPNPITNRSLKIDNKAATANFGPYGPYSGAYYYSGLFNPVSAGTHTFTIRVTDNKNLTTTYNGAFVALPVGGASAVGAGSVTIVTAAQLAPMIAQIDRQLTAAQNARMWADDNSLLPHSADLTYGMLNDSHGLAPIDRAIPVQHVDLPTAIAHGMSQVLDEGHSDSQNPLSSTVPLGEHPLFGQDSLLPMPGEDSSPAADQPFDLQTVDLVFASVADAAAEAALAAA